MEVLVEKHGYGLSWRLRGKESIFQCKRRGFDPGSRKNPHTAERLSPCARTTKLCPGDWGPRLRSPHATAPEAGRPRARARQQGKYCSETLTTTRGGPLLAATRGKPTNQEPAESDGKVINTVRLNTKEIWPWFRGVGK